MKTLSFSELRSHPDKSLLKHLEEVSEFSRKTISRKKLNFASIDSQTIEQIAFIIGAGHDFGKSTIFFQEYIDKKTDDKQKALLKNKPVTNHGKISAVFTYFLLKEFLRDRKDVQWYLPIFGYLIVKRHHGNLKNPVSEIVDFDVDDIEVLNEQINSIVTNPEIFSQVIQIYQTILPDYEVRSFFEQTNSVLKEIKKSKTPFRDSLEKEQSLELYVLFQLLYSTLINSDKMDAADLVSSLKNNTPYVIDDQIVDNYRKKKNFDKSQDKIGTIRNSIYEDVVAQIDTINLQNKIYSLNVPTGTGKTLASLSFGLKLRAKISKEHGYSPKIIYTLPFLSVIDQNFSVFDEVFKTVQGTSPSTDILLKHHHLSDIFYSQEKENDEQIEFKEDKAQILIEGWNSEIVVTTFIQLFHSLISSKNRLLRKFQSIANSIIILDEVQSIPHKYWLLMKELLNSIAHCCNVYFIFVTATQPLIFNEMQGEILELVPNKIKYFEQFDRIELQYQPEIMMIGEFQQKVLRDLEANPTKSFLIVLNTINSTKELFEDLKTTSLADTDYYYLSTNITPKERLERILKIKNEKNKQRKVIVSTQLIEAGVDIDVDIVYRDLAPLDSINQVSGRCNRNYAEGKKGEVRIFTLIDGKNEYYKCIYPSFLIEKTKDVLKGSDIISEKQFLELNNQYFQKVKLDQSEHISKERLEDIKNLQFDNLQKNFQLIEKTYEKTDVFIELDAAAKKIWAKYNEICANPNLIERKCEFLGIKKEFYEYVISIKSDDAPPIINSKTGIAYVPHDNLSSFYDENTGYKKGVLIF
jgi:CRISPR-associated endonuclease/helicase Cas3